MYSYCNYKTMEVVTTTGWQALVTLKKRSMAKGHVWQEMRYIPITITPSRHGPYYDVRPQGERYPPEVAQ